MTKKKYLSIFFQIFLGPLFFKKAGRSLPSAKRSDFEPVTKRLSFNYIVNIREKVDSRKTFSTFFKKKSATLGQVIPEDLRSGKLIFLKKAE